MVGEAHVYVQASRLKMCATSHLVGFQTPRSPQGRILVLNFLSKFFLRKPDTKTRTIPSWDDILHQLRQKERETESNNARNTQNTIDIVAIINTETLRLLLRHIKTIVTKYEQAIYRDDYGNVEIDKALKEVDYFINKTVRNSLMPPVLPSHISKEDYMRILLDSLNDTNDLREQINEFIKIHDESDFEIAVSSIAIEHMVYMSAGRCSDKTLQFLLGNDYHSLSNLALATRDDGFKNVEQAQAAHNAMINNLIHLADLASLQKWFCERFEHSANLASIITGQEFELFCQKRLQDIGWTVKTTRATGDFGADLVAERAGSTIILQCKYYSQPIGVKAVQEAFSAMTFYNAQKAAVVSNQSYTKAARQMAQKNSVILLHVNELDRLMDTV